MGAYIAKRLLLLVPTLLALSVIVFLLTRMMPGDVALFIIEQNGGTVRAEEVEKLRHELGLDRSPIVQYVTWLRHVASLDFGTSLRNGVSVRENLAQRLPLTGQLALMTVAVTALVAIPVGVLSALRRGTWVDYLGRLFAVTGMAVPNFVVGIAIILGAVFLFNWSPPLGYKLLWEDPLGNLAHFAIPALVLGYYHASIVARMVRSSLLEVLDQDYVRTARAKGVGPMTTVFRHALRNALIPVVTVLGLEAAQLLAGVVIIENLFGIPGVGNSIVDAVHSRDWPMLEGTLVLIGLLFALTNLVVDLTYARLDPRIRYQ